MKKASICPVSSEEMFKYVDGQQNLCDLEEWSKNGHGLYRNTSSSGHVDNRVCQILYLTLNLLTYRGSNF